MPPPSRYASAAPSFSWACVWACVWARARAWACVWACVFVCVCVCVRVCAWACVGNSHHFVHRLKLRAHEPIRLIAAQHGARLGVKERCLDAGAAHDLAIGIAGQDQARPEERLRLPRIAAERRRSLVRQEAVPRAQVFRHLFYQLAPLPCAQLDTVAERCAREPKGLNKEGRHLVQRLGIRSIKLQGFDLRRQRHASSTGTSGSALRAVPCTLRRRPREEVHDGD
jgi:hypothetical protein